MTYCCIFENKYNTKPAFLYGMHVPSVKLAKLCVKRNYPIILYCNGHRSYRSRLTN